MKIKKSANGFGLIELILFIVIFGVASVAILRALQTILTYLPDAHRQAVATELAQGRMDVILGQFKQKGFSNFGDPCPGAAVCQTFSGYTITSTISAVSGSSPPAKTITVTVSGLGSASVTSQVTG